jgi:ppGpp synthetase/RelA/SpoT-type nucleotidyltranferase
MKKEILIEYDQKKPLYDSLGNKCETLIRELLEVNNIIVHHLSHRTKDKVKLEEKVVRKGFKYRCLGDITDISGIRIITYFAEDVDTIADIIQAEFKVDSGNTIDKRDLEEDKFGYMSMHYVVSISSPRAKLAEYKKLKDLKFEIQIRSILQHGWAEIEHDLGYKGAKGIPSEFKRDFNRIAALLETADNEFNRLRKQLSTYDITVEKDFKSLQEDLKINNSTLRQFIEQSKQLDSINREIAKIYNVSLDPGTENIEMGELTEKLKFNGFSEINDLSKVLKDSFKDLKSALPELMKYDIGLVTEVNKSVGLHTLIDYINTTANNG